MPHQPDERRLVADRRGTERTGPRRGRRCIDNARRLTLSIKVSASEKARIAEVALLNKQSPTEFVRAAVLDAASDCSDEPVFRLPADIR